MFVVFMLLWCSLCSIYGEVMLYVHSVLFVL